MIRIGIVGCGRILAAHLAGFRLLREAGYDDFAITALCSRKLQDAESYVRRGEGPPQRAACSHIPGDPLAINDEYLSDFQDSSRVAIFDDYRALAAHRDVDAVMDLTPHAMHHAVADAVFQHKKHLLSQKPMAASVRSARRMCEQADEAQCVFGVFECFRFLPLSRALTWLFRSGLGGSFQMALLGYVGAWWAPDRIVADTAWRHKRADAGGITLDLGPHFFDQLRSVAGLPVSFTAHASIIEPVRRRKAMTGATLEEVSCDADDTLFGTIEFAGGGVANLSASWAGHVAPTFYGAGSVYYGSSARVDGSMVELEDGICAELVELYQSHADADELAGVFPRGIMDWFALGQHDWIEGIRHNRQPESSGEEGLLNLACSYALLESNFAGERVALDDVLSGKVHAFQEFIDRRMEI